MISPQHQQQHSEHQLRTSHLMTDTIISQARQANAPTTTSTTASSSSSASHSVPMNGDINARRDAASMMMSMSHLMDAAAVHAHHQQHQHPKSATAATSSIAGNSAAGGLSTAQSVMNSIHSQVHSHHNHTQRGPHKKTHRFQRGSR